MKDFNFKEWFADMSTFVFATLIVGFGTTLTMYYVSAVPSITSVLVGLVGLFIIYPAIKSWQERIKRLF
jgi:putative Mn2+ efflux pump MntP